MLEVHLLLGLIGLLAIILLGLLLLGILGCTLLHFGTRLVKVVVSKIKEWCLYLWSMLWRGR